MDDLVGVSPMTSRKPPCCFSMKFPEQRGKKLGLTSSPRGTQFVGSPQGADLRSVLDFMVRVNLDTRGACRRPKELGQLPEAGLRRLGKQHETGFDVGFDTSMNRGRDMG